MNLKRITILVSILFISILSAFSQDDIVLKADTKSEVFVGERFRITYEINADASRFNPPSFGKFHKLSGPNTSQSSSIQIINGNYKKTFQLTYTFIVTASEEGDFEIGPASAVVNSKTYTSNKLKIKVVKRANNNNPSASRPAGSGSTVSDGNIKDDDIFLRTTVSKTNPYQGEQIILSTKIYTKVGVSNLNMDKSPSFEGFWNKDLMDDKNRLKQSSEVLNGVEYIVAEISRYALFPQKSGKLIIDPIELNCVAQIQVQNKRRRSRDPFDDFFNDPFFNRNTKNVEVTLKSQKLLINVKPLPQQGKPDSFTGAVGKFSFTSTLDNDTISTNDALNLNLKLSGVGNLELVFPPKIKFPTDFESYDPKVNNRIRTSASGVSGSRTMEYLAIARNPGDFTIGPLEFSYFDVSQAKYKTIKSGPYNIHVTKGSGSSSSGISYSSSAQEDIKYIGKDIHHIKQGDIQLFEINKFFFGTTMYYVLVILPLLILIVIILLIKNERKKRGNTSLMKTKKANKIARMRLAKAEKLLSENNDTEFYNELALAIWGYLADKFLIQQADLSIEKVSEILRAKKVNNDINDGFINILNSIEFARFAPGDGISKMKSLYEDSLNTITLAEKALK